MKPNKVYDRASAGTHISLTQGQWAIVDALDWRRLCHLHWYATKRRNTFYACANIVNDLGKRTVVYMHDLVLLPPPGKLVDHRNGNGCDNRRANIRVTTHSQNALNMHRTRKDNTSGHTGVYWVKQHQLWKAVLHLNGKDNHLGYFKDKAGAIAARKVAMAKEGL